jgi:hypothetical protein
MTCRFSRLAFALSLLVGLAVFADPASQSGQGVIHHSRSDSVEGGRIPRYAVDASWPKPLPNNWLIGQVGGLAVDKHDHIWISQATAHVWLPGAGPTDRMLLEFSRER